MGPAWLTAFRGAVGWSPSRTPSLLPEDLRPYLHSQACSDGKKNFFPSLFPL